ncbi:hypothetical protein MKW98_007010 [Papaver atlanticum]|uniref:Uncharacterized protein n=1 Tax=Papaver atlanticum TaxID=357466 RepID=A0AAD4STG6_9MAGN|nr:hypothetical protein MKW98_007010 [Papaver atlanticum]
MVAAASESLIELTDAYKTASRLSTTAAPPTYVLRSGVCWQLHSYWPCLGFSLLLAGGGLGIQNTSLNPHDLLILLGTYYTY